MPSARLALAMCHVNLADKDGVVTVIKVYMDETGTHEGASVLAVSAYFARPSEWIKWQKKWNAAKRPIKVFHSSECQALRGEFASWTPAKRDALVAKLLPVIREHKLGGVIVGIQMDHFRKALDNRPDLLRLLGSPYGACFQWAITTIVKAAYHFGGSHRIAFIQEMNDFKGEILNAFEYVKAQQNPKSRSRKMLIRWNRL